MQAIENLRCYRKDCKKYQVEAARALEASLSLFGIPEFESQNNHSVTLTLAQTCVTGKQ
jgi:hypothetical protein